jgi:signal peptidase
VRRWWGITVQVVSWTVILAVAVVLCLAVLVPRLAGATPYTVLTGSMEPDLPPGSLVVTRPTELSDISVGDVVTYQLRSGEPTVVTHRVVAVGFDATGEPLLTTQGDANDVADAKPVRAVQVRGTVWYSVPHLGRVNTALDGSQRQTAVYVVATALLLYAAWMFAGALTSSRRTGATAVTESTTLQKEEVAR